MSLAIKAADLMAIAFQSAGFTIQWELQSPTGMAATPFDGASPLLNTREMTVKIMENDIYFKVDVDK